MDLHAPVQRALASAGVINVHIDPLVAMLRGHVSTSVVSHHIAQHSKSKVQERAADGERFSALHDALRARGVPELDKLTIFLQRVVEEKAVVEMLRLASDSKGGSCSGSVPRALSGVAYAVSSERGSALDYSFSFSSATAPSGAPSDGKTPTGASSSVPAGTWESGWLLNRPFLSGSYLVHGVREQLAGTNASFGMAGAASLGALPVAEQEAVLVADLLRVLSGVEGNHMCSAPAPSLDDAGTLSSGAAHLVKAQRVKFFLPHPPSPRAGTGAQQRADRKFSSL